LANPADRMAGDAEWLGWEAAKNVGDDVGVNGVPPSIRERGQQ
jgi:hypothetical protein